MFLLHGILRALRVFVDSYLVPRRCPVCGAELARGESLMCMSCLMRIPVCNNVGAGLMHERVKFGNVPFEAGIAEAWFNYDPASAYAVLVRNAKYAGNRRAAFELGRLLGLELQRRHTLNLDVLLPMPMHWSKVLRRGYNQAQIIAEGVGDVLGVPVGDNLVAVRPHGTQTRLGFSSRAANIAGSYRCEHPEELEELHVAVVDDIITTGASMNEAVMAIALCGGRPATVSLLAAGATTTWQ
ncbi:MAG: hypothetical protein K2L28_04155 [Muribaculaceae bacterium]|nr:hypothetical protein [Muribaculaceae bacterium]